MKNINKLILLIYLFCLMGCDKFVDIDSPEDQLVTKSVFENDETAISAITGLYANMINTNSLAYNIAFYCGIYSDELDYKLGSLPTLSAYTNNLNAKESPTNAFWINGYSYIYQANSIIEGLATTTKVGTVVKNQLLGEALFVRAFWYYYLLNLYGDIPWVSSTDYASNAVLPKTTRNVILGNIIDDLIKAKELLPQEYVAANSISETMERIRPNFYVATALLSRIYLLAGNWELANQETTLVIENSSKFSLEKTEDVFKSNSKEAIWQLPMPLPANYNTWEGQYFTLIAVPNGVLSNSSTISSTVLNCFEDNDKRKSLWIGIYTDNSKTPNVDYYFSNKYKRLFATPATEHSICLRLAEMFLTRAEARAQLNLIPGSIEDVDKVRQRAEIGLIKITNPSIGKGALLDSILQERQREFFCEWGHRWFDLKRSGKINEVMDIVSPQKGGVWSSFKSAWPIPQSDIDNNRKLVQNEGYN